MISKQMSVKIGAKVASHGRYVAFQKVEVAIPRSHVAENLRADRRAALAAGHINSMRHLLPRVPTIITREVCLEDGKSVANRPSARSRQPSHFTGRLQRHPRLEKRRHRRQSWTGSDLHLEKLRQDA